MRLAASARDWQDGLLLQHVIMLGMIL